MKVVVLGASTNRSKFGNKAVRSYQKFGATVFPVNPSATEIEGVPAYSSLTALPETEINRLLVYLPPSVGITLLAEMQQLNPEEIWFNPGSESAQLLEQADELGLNVITGCSIVAIGHSPAMFSDE
ncbi:MAG: CoA-binding protein [Planctomycetaceae bacterium]|nr:CoA-binding protein [Planctomycetaceae bacterium]